jgi:inhibitor of cysteine peptidase
MKLIGKTTIRKKGHLIMSNRYLTIILCVSTLFVINCNGKYSGSITKLDNGNTITIPIDKDVNIKLEANLSTGYSWELVTIDSNVIKLKESSYKSNKNIPGSNGMQQITFIPVSAGVSVLKLGYLRPWEGISSMIDSFNITVKVHK